MKITKLNDYKFKIEKEGDMNVEAVFYATENMLEKIKADRSLEQLKNVTTLPGIFGYAVAMPDIHWGYGFPVGGVAAFRVDDGVISPGGIGYDISCGVRLLKTEAKLDEVKDRIKDVAGKIFNNVPSGVGETGKLKLNNKELEKILLNGAQEVVAMGYGEMDDFIHAEDTGRLSDADPSIPTKRAYERGAMQLGTLGSGNHFLEIQYVDEIYDEKVAEAFGLFLNQITIMIHTGSRGFGHQVCSDFIEVMLEANKKYGIKLVDKQLACAPFKSPEAKDYFLAMNAAGNYARANRQLITHRVREASSNIFGKISVLYDICHNTGKIEEYNGQKVIVHRKGATRAFPQGHKDIPEKYRNAGQPVLIPGTMGTSSYVLAGTLKAMEESFGSTCHGAGRMMSRAEALRKIKGGVVKSQLESEGIYVFTDSLKGLAEEVPFAYKDVNQVVDVCHNAGISSKVARLKPLAVIKG